MRSLMMLCLAGTLACGDKDDTDTGAEADADTDTDSDTDTDTDSDADTDADADADTDADTDTQGYKCDGTEWEEARAGGDAGAYMAECVMPAMQAHFQKYDSKRYADFNCATCHGEDFGGGTYQMPAVFSLNWDYAKYWAKNGIYVGDGSGFMEEVSADMTALLGYDPYDYKTGEGFGCYGCHNY